MIWTLNPCSEPKFCCGNGGPDLLVSSGILEMISLCNSHLCSSRSYFLLHSSHGFVWFVIFVGFWVKPMDLKWTRMWVDPFQRRNSIETTRVHRSGQFKFQGWKSGVLNMIWFFPFIEKSLRDDFLEGWFLRSSFFTTLRYFGSILVTFGLDSIKFWAFLCSCNVFKELCVVGADHPPPRADCLLGPDRPPLGCGPSV